MPLDDPDRAAARENLCRLLAACHYQPEAAFLEEGVFANLAQAATTLGPELATAAAPLDAAFRAEGLEPLLVEYTRLFLGPVEAVARPYGSVWLTKEKTLMQPVSHEVAAIYEEGGFELAEAFTDLPDHVVAELEFLYVLLFKENRARRDGDVSLASVLALKSRFLREHLGAWTPAFCGAVEKGSTSPFYRGLAALTRAFVAAEVARAAQG